MAEGLINDSWEVQERLAEQAALDSKDTCKICGGPIKQSTYTGAWFHIQALPYVHSQPLALHNVQPDSEPRTCQVMEANGHLCTRTRGHTGEHACGHGWWAEGKETSQPASTHTEWKHPSPGRGGPVRIPRPEGLT